MMLNLPNLLTLTNLLLGCASLMLLFEGELQSMLYCMLGAVVADSLDGMVARALKMQSKLGKELDSIADMVTFGLVPGAMLFVLLYAGIHEDDPIPGQGLFPPYIPFFKHGVAWCWWAFPGFLFTAFAGLRLAKFNIDTRQSESFLGLATPAATFFVLGLLMIARENFLDLRPWLANIWVVYGIIAALCLLMVSELPLFSIKTFSWSKNKAPILFGIFSMALLVIWRENAFSFIVAAYVLVGALMALFNGSKPKAQKN